MTLRHTQSLLRHLLLQFKVRHKQCMLLESTGSEQAVCCIASSRPVSPKESPGYKFCTPAGSSGTSALSYSPLNGAFYIPESWVLAHFLVTPIQSISCK